MKEVADIAKEGRTALLEKDYTKLAALMNSNFDLRRFVISAYFRLRHAVGTTTHRFIMRFPGSDS